MRSPLLPVRHADLAAQAAQAARVVPGDEVEIWCRSLGTWSHGFVAVDIDDDGWRVLRRSDRSPLPVRFPDTDVRLAPAAHQGPHAG